MKVVDTTAMKEIKTIGEVVPSDSDFELRTRSAVAPGVRPEIISSGLQATPLPKSSAQNAEKIPGELVQGELSTCKLLFLGPYPQRAALQTNAWCGLVLPLLLVFRRSPD
ncbi:hypothetical protein NN561_000408 [Cricetulus griseus]